MREAGRPANHRRVLRRTTASRGCKVYVLPASAVPLCSDSPNGLRSPLTGWLTPVAAGGGRIDLQPHPIPVGGDRWPPQRERPKTEGGDWRPCVTWNARCAPTPRPHISPRLRGPAPSLRPEWDLDHRRERDPPSVSTPWKIPNPFSPSPQLARVRVSVSEEYRGANKAPHNQGWNRSGLWKTSNKVQIPWGWNLKTSRCIAPTPILLLFREGPNLKQERVCSRNAWARTTN